MNTVERFVDGQATVDEFRGAEELALQAEEESNGAEAETMTETGSAAVSYAFQTMNIHTVQHVVEFAYSEFACPATMRGLNRSAIDTRADEERKRQACIFRDIFDNPFHTMSVDPSWLTSTVAALAEGIYQEHAFDRMPILADALQDAGCDNADILNHCRGESPHVRGCWVVDLLLGKA
ncbi:hypothetical protein [Frigoriglobus tundricola]|uniref:hypothetical protein n=1 Tax=Frigoriglobus tundricola TaxID=2774151 RepID=UPI001D09009D|nr:hypothetical protein [Frigoriglobus tundricola]